MTSRRERDAYRAGLEYLDASERRRGVTYYAAEVDATYLLTRREVAGLGLMLIDGVDDAYSHWCDGGAGRKLRRGR